MNEWLGDIKREGRVSALACVVEIISESKKDWKSGYKRFGREIYHTVR